MNRLFASAITCLERRALMSRPSSLRALTTNITRNISWQRQVPAAGSVLNKQLVSPMVMQQRFASPNPASMVEVRDRVMYNLHLYDKIDQTKMFEGSHFISDLGLDSLDQVEIIMAMENEFNHYIPDNDAEKLLTPQEIIDYICDKYDIIS